MNRCGVLKTLSVVAGVCGATLLSTSAVAGEKYGSPVAVSSYAIWGSMGATRASGYSNDYLEISDQGSVIYVRARQGSTGVSGSCVTSDPVKMAQLRAAKSDAYVYAGISSGQCSSLTVTNNSAMHTKDY